MKNIGLVIRHLMSLIHESYALVIIDSENPEVLYAAKNKSRM